MIFGNGLIASALQKYFFDKNDFSIFAAGVSNSNEDNPLAFLREKNALLGCIEAGGFLVYFSTCSLDDSSLPETPYIKHKLDMESICKNSEHYAIFRLPQVVGSSDNPYTLTNFLRNAIANKSKFKVWQNASRVLIDVDDVASIVSYLLEESLVNNSTINIAHRYALPVLEIVAIFEELLGLKANFELIDKGNTYAIDCSLSSEVAIKLSIDFDAQYNKRLIRKYYENKLEN